MPSITSTLTIHGAGVDTTVIERDASARPFRLVHVAATGTLRLKGLTLHQGSGFELAPGGGIFNAGTLTLTDAAVTNNQADRAGGLYNQDGTVTIVRTLFTGNGSSHGGGGLYNQDGTVRIRQTTFAANRSDGGGGLVNDNGVMTITHSAIVENFSSVGAGGGIGNIGGLLRLTNTTLWPGTS